jgi:hypothetical protein
MSVTWTQNARALLNRGYQRLGVLSTSGVMTDGQANKGLDVLNAMLKGMQADGINLYRQQQVSATVPAMAGCPSNPFVLTPLIMECEECRYVLNPEPDLNEREMGRFQYADYMALPNKMSQSTSGPTIWVFDKQVSQSLFYFFPLNPFSMTINMTVGRTVNDVNTLDDVLDFPSEWTEGMDYAIADRLMDDDGVAAADPATAERISQRAVAFYTKLLNFDRPTSIFLRPYGRARRSKIWRGQR